MARGGLLLAGAGASLLVAAPLLAGALAVWAGTLADVSNLDGSGREVLRGRVLLYLVVGVTLLLLAALATGPRAGQ